MSSTAFMMLMRSAISELAVSVVARAEERGIVQIFFGSTDGSLSGFSDEPPEERQPAGIRHGISGGQWEYHIDFEDLKVQAEGAEVMTEDQDKWTPVGYSAGVGMSNVRFIQAKYHHDTGLIRLQPRLRLGDI